MISLTALLEPDLECYRLFTTITSELGAAEVMIQVVSGGGQGPAG